MDKLVRRMTPSVSAAQDDLVSNLAPDALRPGCCPERVPPFLHVVAAVRLRNITHQQVEIGSARPITSDRAGADRRPQFGENDCLVASCGMSIKSAPSRITASARRPGSLQPAGIGQSVRIA